MEVQHDLCLSTNPRKRIELYSRKRGKFKLSKFVNGANTNFRTSSPGWSKVWAWCPGQGSSGCSVRGVWWGPDITPGGSEKQCVDTQRESGDLLLTYAWYQLPKFKAHSRVNWVAPLALQLFISPQTRRKQGCSACSKLQVWKGRRSTLETTHLKDCQLNQFSVSTKSCNIHLSTWPSTYLYDIHIYSLS